MQRGITSSFVIKVDTLSGGLTFFNFSFFIVTRHPRGNMAVITRVVQVKNSRNTPRCKVHLPLVKRGKIESSFYQLLIREITANELNESLFFVDDTWVTRD